MFTLYRGNQRVPFVIKDRGCRTQEQFEAVAALMPKIDFICGNPFEGNYEGQEFPNATFRLPHYYNGELRLAKITPTGRVSFLDREKMEYVNEL